MEYQYPQCAHDHLCEFTGGICPIVGCPKELVNGPCGGMRDGGMCEVVETMPCVWVHIYNRLKELGELKKMQVIQEPRNNSFYSILPPVRSSSVSTGSADKKDPKP